MELITLQEFGLPSSQQKDLASRSHERLYTSRVNMDGRRGWMTRKKKEGND